MSNPVIAQHVSPNQSSLLDISAPINAAYCKKYGFDYLKDVSLLCPNDHMIPGREKLTYIIKLLKNLTDGLQVIWLDADVLIVGRESFSAATADISMVRIYHGKNKSTEHATRCNSGVIVMRNTKSVRDLFAAVLSGNYMTDEEGLAKCLPSSGCSFKALDPKWNCWHNNRHLVKSPNVLAFHSCHDDGKFVHLKTAAAKIIH